MSETQTPKPEALPPPSHSLWNEAPLNPPPGGFSGPFPKTTASQLIGESSRASYTAWPWRYRLHACAESTRLLREMTRCVDKTVEECVDAIDWLIFEWDHGFAMTSRRQAQEGLYRFLGGLTEDETALLVSGDLDLPGRCVLPPWELTDDDITARSETECARRVRL